MRFNHTSQAWTSLALLLVLLLVATLVPPWRFGGAADLTLISSYLERSSRPRTL